MASGDSDDERHHQRSSSGVGKSNWIYIQAEIKRMRSRNEFGYINKDEFGKMIEV